VRHARRHFHLSDNDMRIDGEPEVARVEIFLRGFTGPSPYSATERGGHGMRIEHARGRIWLRMGFTENFEFLTRIRQLNPSVEIRGV
jgi:hypothetical protein